MTFRLPPQIVALVEARNALRDHYRSMLEATDAMAELSFTFDGNLVGDLGEALAVELFGITLVEGKSFEGIDGFAPDGETTVQVKATGTARGPAFRCTERRADHLLFFDLSLEENTGVVVFNGPEAIGMRSLPREFKNQRMVSPTQIRLAAADVPESKRLKVLPTARGLLI